MRAQSPYRAGPWPGLTARGAWVLLGYAGLLALGVLAAGPARRPLPDLALLAFLTCVPLLMATRVTRVPGAASAVCGAYLLPRTLVSLFDPGVEPPPLLIVPAIALDVLTWGRLADLGGVSAAWPRRTHGWPSRRVRVERRVETARLAIGAAAYGLLLAAVVPPWAMLVGGMDPGAWTGTDLWLGSAAATLICALEGWLIGRPRTRSRRSLRPADRGTGSSPP